MKHATMRNIVVTILCIALGGCSPVKDAVDSADYEVMVVRLPPVHDPKLTPLQNFYTFHRFLYPMPDEPPIEKMRGETGTWQDLPNDDTLLQIVLSETGEISINAEPQASVDSAVNRLSEIFVNRREMGVYAPGTDRVVKAVGIRIPHSAKYSELVRIVRAVKGSGADPVVLLIDGHLPYQKVQ